MIPTFGYKRVSCAEIVRIYGHRDAQLSSKWVSQEQYAARYTDARLAVGSRAGMEEALWLRRKFTRKGNEIRICVV